MLSRRRILGSMAGAAAASVVNLGFLRRLRPVSAAEQRVNASTLRLDDSIEPLVRLLESTSRDAIIEEVARRVNAGLSYRQLLAALLLAGVRNVEPRPTVGFQFHCVLVVHSAHLASISGPAADRWLPIFWAIDYFKNAQARDTRERDWTMAAVDESALPPPRQARQQFVDAMEQWDEEKADAAVTQLARTATPQRIFELFFRYGARDYRSIGHKAIYVANSYRTMQVIGEQHAEPIFRSLAYALLNRTGGPNPAESDLAADRPWRLHQGLADRFPAEWQHGQARPEATRDLLTALREAGSEDAGERVIATLEDGAGPQAVWDALFETSAELLLRRPNIVALHAVTTTNAIHQCYRWSGDERTRRLLLLQNAAFLPMFLDSMRGRGDVPDRTLAAIAPDAEPEAAPPASIERIFETLGRDHVAAARQALTFLENGGDAHAMINTARQLVFAKGNDAHDYKFSSAVLEDYYHVSPRWRNVYLAANIGRLRSSNERDNPLIHRIRDALA